MSIFFHCKVVEKLAYDSHFSMHFQKNAWVDTTTMIQLAEEFVQRFKDRNNGLGCLLFCENLSAHVAKEVNFFI